MRSGQIVRNEKHVSKPLDHPMLSDSLVAFNEINNLGLGQLRGEKCIFNRKPSAGMPILREACWELRLNE